jgi:hypothetical protein
MLKIPSNPPLPVRAVKQAWSDWAAPAEDCTEEYLRRERRSAATRDSDRADGALEAGGGRTGSIHAAQDVVWGAWDQRRQGDGQQADCWRGCMAGGTVQCGWWRPASGFPFSSEGG